MDLNHGGLCPKRVRIWAEDSRSYALSVRPGLLVRHPVGHRRRNLPFALASCRHASFRFVASHAMPAGQGKRANEPTGTCRGRVAAGAQVRKRECGADCVPNAESVPLQPETSGGTWLCSSRATSTVICPRPDARYGNETAVPSAGRREV